MERKPMKKMTPKERKKFARQGTSDKEQLLWEKKKLGKSKEHVEKSKFFKNPTKLISIRVPEELLHELKEIAEEEGLRYQTYILSLLTKHVRHKKISNA